MIEAGMILLTLAMLMAPVLSAYAYGALDAVLHGVQWLTDKIQSGYDYVSGQISNLFPEVQEQPADPSNGTAQPADQGPAVQSPAPPAPEPTDPAPVVEQKIEGNFRQQEIMDLANSESVRQRMLTFTLGWTGITQSPFWGDYAGHIRDFDNPGMYMHNALSVWQQFGIISFLLYVFLSVRAFLVSGVKVVLQNAKEDRAWRLVLLVSVYALSLVIVSKAIYWPVPAFAWGLYAARVAAGCRERSDTGAAQAPGWSSILPLQR